MKLLSFIHPYWHDQAILNGLEKLFDLFMSKDLAKPRSNGERGVIVDLTLNDGLVHDTLTGIVTEITTGMGSDLPYLYKSQVTSRQLVAQGRARYQSLLRHSPSDDVAEESSPRKKRRTTA